MEKSRIEIEHTLNSTSRNITWQLIGTDAGLEKWLADSVQIDGDKAEFGWGDDWRHHEIRCATVITIDKFKRIVWRWDDEDDTSYVEIRMERSQMTQQYTLYITDFTDEDDMEWLRDAWKHNFKRLYQSCGV